VQELLLIVIQPTIKELQNLGLCNEKSDVWSMGCIIHEMCTLKTPFTVVKDDENQITDWKYEIFSFKESFLRFLTHF
jgi:serine/threonine protein kinase